MKEIDILESRKGDISQEASDNHREFHLSIVNKTPHPITILDDNGRVIEKFDASPNPIRIEERQEQLGILVSRYTRIPIDTSSPYEEGWEEITRTPLVKKSLGIANLPPEREGILYIVSLPVAIRYNRRKDFVIPNELVRDSEGRVIGCRSLARLL